MQICPVAELCQRDLIQRSVTVQPDTGELRVRYNDTANFCQRLAKRQWYQRHRHNFWRVDRPTHRDALRVKLRNFKTESRVKLALHQATEQQRLGFFQRQFRKLHPSHIRNGYGAVILNCIALTPVLCCQQATQLGHRAAGRLCRQKHHIPDADLIRRLFHRRRNTHVQRLGARLGFKNRHWRHTNAAPGGRASGILEKRLRKCAWCIGRLVGDLHRVSRQWHNLNIVARRFDTWGNISRTTAGQSGQKQSGENTGQHYSVLHTVPICLPEFESAPQESRGNCSLISRNRDVIARVCIFRGALR